MTMFIFGLSGTQFVLGFLAYFSVMLVSHFAWRDSKREYIAEFLSICKSLGFNDEQLQREYHKLKKMDTLDVMFRLQKLERGEYRDVFEYD